MYVIEFPNNLFIVGFVDVKETNKFSSVSISKRCLIGLLSSRLSTLFTVQLGFIALFCVYTHHLSLDQIWGVWVIGVSVHIHADPGILFKCTLLM